MTFELYKSMSYEKINEAVEVLALFKKDKAMPFILKWGQLQIRVLKVNMVNKFYIGDTLCYYFFVSDESNSFKLFFDTENLKWRLEEVYSE